MATMYVTEQGARVEKEYRRLLVTKEDEVLMAAPLGRVSQVVLVGNVGVTTPALLMLLREGVGLTLVSRAGQLRGHLVPPMPKNLPLRHRQYERARDGDFCLAVGRAVVDGKLRNCRTLALRMARSRPQVAEGEALRRLEESVQRVKTVADLAELRGIEGVGTRAYFEVFRRALREGWEFERRVRRPPTDPINSLLSFGYTLLTDNLGAACEVVGLDRYDGFFHADKYGRPALALDLVEEFRGVVVDSVVLTLVNKRMVEVEGDFRPGPGGAVYLRKRGLRVFLRQYSARLNTRILHPHVKRRLTYQQCFEVQARLLAKVIQGDVAAYRPFRVR